MPPAPALGAQQQPVDLVAEEVADELAALPQNGGAGPRRGGFWRQGYAYEAAAALTDHLFRDQGAHKVVAETEDALRSLLEDADRANPALEVLYEK